MKAGVPLMKIKMFFVFFIKTKQKEFEKQLIETKSLH